MSRLDQYKGKATENFGRSARRIVLGIILATAGLTQANAQELAAEDKLADNDSISAEAEFQTVYFKGMSDEKRFELNELVRERGREKFADLLEENGTRYKTYLDSLQTSAVAYMERQGVENTDFILMNPHEVETGLALDVDLVTILEEVLQEYSSSHKKSLRRDAADIVKELMMYEQTPLATKIGSMQPFVIEAEGSQGTPVMVPASAHGYVSQIPGLGFKATRDFVNNHEKWHVIDRMMGLSRAIIESIPDGGFRNDESLMHKAASRGAFVYTSEAFSDVATLGEMIFNAHSPEIIGHIINWRYNHDHDLSHMSPPHMKDLQDRIDKMGVETFRGMSEDARLKTYLEIAREHALSPKDVLKIDKIAKAGLVRKHFHQLSTLFSGRARLAFDFLNMLETHDTPKPKPVLTAEETIQLEEKLEKLPDYWDVLCCDAQTHSGKVTPETLMPAYTRLQNDLMQELEKAKTPADYAYAIEKMQRLQDRYIVGNDEVDFLELNERRGVNLVEIEPYLQDKAPARTLDLSPWLKGP